LDPIVEFNLERSFYDAFFISMIQHAAIGPGTQNQIERTNENALSGTGFSGDDVESLIKGNTQPIDDGVVAYSEQMKHCGKLQNQLTASYQKREILINKKPPG